MGTLHHKLNRNILMKYRGLSPKDHLTKLKGAVPTFKEFVSFLLDEVRTGHDLDMHWTPVYSFCNPCQVNFTHVVKFETFDRDSNVIVSAAGLQNFLARSNGKLSHENPSKGMRGEQRTMESYLQELSGDQIRNLTKLYQPDFDIFGYEAPTLSKKH